jgi:hypothetical protein
MDGRPVARSRGTLIAAPERMLRWSLLTCVCLAVTARSAIGAQYKVVVRHIDRHTYQAEASKVIIETRTCGDWIASDEPEDAILNWEGSHGNNWILFTASKMRCDVVTIR